MNITKRSDTLDQLLLEASPPRTPGLHLSHIIRSILQSLEPKKYLDGPVNSLYTDPGFTFERVLETAWASRHAGKIVRPGEFTHDGIIVSPDYIDFTDEAAPVLVESKMTEMSSVGCPLDPKFRKWLWQIAGYLKALELTRARLHVLWLKGDYRQVRRDYGCWDIEFTQEEIDHTWGLLTGHALSKGWLVQTPGGLVDATLLPQN